MTDRRSHPLVSVVVPVRNEADDIAGCVESIAQQTWPRPSIEVLLVDGESTDRTVSIAREVAAAADLDLQVVNNPGRTAATALNLGLEHSTGEIVVRVDARARIDAEHVTRCAGLLLGGHQIGVVGGGQRPVVRSQAGLVERSIVRALRNRWTTGLAKYRRGGEAGPVDTVWLGAVRRADLVRVGGWPTYPEQNQDFRLNQRLAAEGLTVWFEPDLTADYLPRRSLSGLARQYLRFGLTKGELWAGGEQPSPRQVVLLAVPAGAGLVTLGALRRWGWARVVSGWLALGLMLDHVGQHEPAPASERLGAVVATGVADGSWILGVVIGASRSWRR